MLYTFFHGNAPRSVGFVYSPDWFDHVADGSLNLLVVLHGGNQDITDFMRQRIEIARLMKGEFHRQPQKLVAIFPEGLSRELDIGGSWRAGHIGGAADVFGHDDVSYVFACIALVDQMLARELKRLRGLTVDSVFTNQHRYLVGFSNGAAMVGQILARRPDWFTAAGMHSHVFAGYKHLLLADDFGQVAQTNYPARLVTVADPVGVLVDPGISLMHLVGTLDDRVLSDFTNPNRGSPDVGGTPPGTTAGLDAYIEGDPMPYYREDEAITDGVMEWAAAIGNTAAAPAFTVSGGVGQRSWAGTRGGTEAAEVRQVMVGGLDHEWWTDATQTFWDFLRQWNVPG